MATESDTSTVQIEIIPYRYLMPETAQRLLNEIYNNGGIERIMVQGPNLPRSIPYGPGKGIPINENRDLLIEVGGQALELNVQVGRITLELTNDNYVKGVEAACKRTLPFSFQIKRGKFFHDRMTISDFAKFGDKVEDKRILGLIDPKAKKDKLVILSDETVACEKEER